MGLFSRAKKAAGAVNPFQDMSLRGVSEHPQRRFLIGIIVASVVISLVIGGIGIALVQHSKPRPKAVPTPSVEQTYYVPGQDDALSLEEQADREAREACDSGGVLPEGQCSNRYGFVEVEGINLADLEHNMLFRPLKDSERSDVRKFAQWAVEAMGTSREQAAHLIPLDVESQWRRYLTTASDSKMGDWSEDFHQNLFDLSAYGRDEDVKYAVTYVSGALPSNMCTECYQYWGDVYKNRGMYGHNLDVVRVDVQVLNDSAQRSAWYEDQLSIYILFSDQRESYLDDKGVWKIETAWAVPYQENRDSAWDMVKPSDGGLPLLQWGGTAKGSDVD